MVTSNPVTTSNRASNTAETCGNCGAPLTGRYCAACGQSREDICRPIWSLLTDTLDGLLSWDGRILTTFRHLYTRPGRVARDYVGGKRASFTPPVRLYIIASVIFFAAISLSGALYFHAAVLLPIAVLVLAGVYIPLPLPVSIAVLALTTLAAVSGVALYDYGFYGSSRLGAVLRAVLICLAYAISAVFVAIGLIIISTL